MPTPVSQQIAFHVPAAGREGFTHVGVRTADGVELTAPQATPASLPGPLPEASSSSGPKVSVQGLTLELELQGSIFCSYTFTGGGPLFLSQVVEQLETGIPLVQALHAGGKLYLASRMVGSSASIEVLLGDAAALLGLPVETKTYGRSAHLPLFPGLERYVVRNPAHLPGMLYQHRLVNVQTGSVSDWSAPFYANTPFPLQQVRCRAQVVDGQGRPMADRVFISYPTTAALEGTTILVAPDPSPSISDARGEVEILMVRGVTYAVVMDGSKTVRRVQAPTDTSIEVFDLYDAAYSEEVDLYAAQTPELANFYAVRALGS